jgi:bla regulator protein blaR1
MVRTGTLTRVSVTLVVLSTAHMLPMRGQLLHPAGQQPSFEVATIKPRDPNMHLLINPLGSESIVHLVGTRQSLVAQAYNAPSPSRMIGPLGSSDSQLYVVEARIPDAIFAQMQTMTTAQRREKTQRMLQALLADRLKLKVHFGMQEMSTYDLVIDKGGAKLPAPTDPATTGVGGWVMSPTGEFKIRNMKLDELLQNRIFGLGDRPIVNKTGLTGTYNLKLNWKPDLPARPGAEVPAAADEPAGPSIFTVLQEQLGLKLVPSRGPVEVLYIDSIEQPSEN